MILLIKRHWFSILLIGILVYILLNNQNHTNELTKEAKRLENVNDVLKKKNELHLKKIDSFAKIDVTLVEKIKYIKLKEDEKIIAVDTMSISSLQSFFSERYKE